MDMRRAASDPAYFRQVLRVDRDGAAVPFASIVQPWQLADLEALDPAWLQIAGRLPADAPEPCRRLWSERPRGASKTTDLAIAVAFVLFSSLRQISGIAAAADTDQARLLRDAVNRLVRLNPWLAQFLEVQNYRILNRHTASTLEIISSDAGSSYGVLPDFICIDEITHWPAERGKALWDSLASSAAKRRHCVVVSILNAGWKSDWQWPLREAIRQDPRWRFSRLEHPPEYIDADRLAEQRSLLPASAYDRLWNNTWQSGSGDSLNLAALHECCTRPGPLRVTPSGMNALASLDIGLRRDHCSLVTVIADHIRQRIVLADIKNWNPRFARNGEVQISDVKQEILRQKVAYGLRNLVVDPWQAASIAQDLAANHGFRVIRWEATAANKSREAVALMEAVNNRALELFNVGSGAELVRDLEKCRVVERPGGFRLDWPRDEAGHCDRGSALAQMLDCALRFVKRLQREEFNPASRYGGVTRVRLG